jgi:ABC-type phosphate transport system auxiliary subunit
MDNIASWIWVLIPLVAIAGGISAGMFKQWVRLKERQLDAANTMSAEKAAQYAAHTERLEQRMRVLERIVTDKGIDVADEIEKLRDDRPN